ncbi:MAG: tetratricopeptide repeat protein [Gammaproteobacteria bacterium]
MPFRNYLRILAVCLALSAIAEVPGTAVAQEKKEGEEKPPAPSMDETTAKRLNEAIELLNTDQYDAAKQAIGKLDLTKLSPYERSRAEQILASIDHAKENFPGARGHLQEALKAGGLNELEILQVRYQIAQLFMAEERWKDGAAALEEWFKIAPTPNAAAYYLLAIAYYQMEDFAKALPPAKKAVELTHKPQQSWLELVLAIHLQREDYKEAIPLLKRLIALTPEKKAYWIQLSSIYGQLEDYENAVIILELAYNAGLLNEDSELRRLADLLVFIDVPYRAGQLLTDAIEKKKVTPDSKLYEKLANCWIAAREYEKAIGPLGRAGELSGNGDIYIRLGEVQVQRHEWPSAADAVRRGIDKGGLKDPANAQLLMGIALYNDKKLKESREWFQRAAASPQRRQTAQSYIQAIDSGL